MMICHFVDYIVNSLTEIFVCFPLNVGTLLTISWSYLFAVNNAIIFHLFTAIIQLHMYLLERHSYPILFYELNFNTLHTFTLPPPPPFHLPPPYRYWSWPRWHVWNVRTYLLTGTDNYYVDKLPSIWLRSRQGQHRPPSPLRVALFVGTTTETRSNYRQEKDIWGAAIAEPPMIVNLFATMEHTLHTDAWNWSFPYRNQAGSIICWDLRLHHLRRCSQEEREKESSLWCVLWSNPCAPFLTINLFLYGSIVWMKPGAVCWSWRVLQFPVFEYGEETRQS